MFNDKKLYKTKIFFPATTKNLNWETLTKNSVTFKDWDGVSRVFPNSSKGWGIRNFTMSGRGGFFYRVKVAWGVILAIWTLKLKAAFCEYWTSIKIKINMACIYVSKEYENKNGAGAMTPAKNAVFIGL